MSSQTPDETVKTVAASADSDAVAVSTPVDGSDELKRRELIEMVVESSGVKKKFAKPVVEAMLATLGASLADGRSLNLPPLGKLRINRTVEKENSRIIVCKVRQNSGQKTPPTSDDADAA